MTAAELITILQRLDPETRVLTVEGGSDPFTTDCFVEYPDPKDMCEGKPYIVICTEGNEVEVDSDVAGDVIEDEEGSDVAH
jgi:hypothetical protein